MNIAIIADWLPTYGGAEHVIHTICQIFPNAPIYTTVVRPEKIGPLAKKTINTSWLQSVYKIFPNHQILLAFMPKAIENFDVSAFDVIISSSHAVGKGIIPPSHAVHICYCHTPMRYAWEMQEDYLREFKIPFFIKPIIRHMLEKLRKWDISTSKRVDFFIANSTETKSRIKRIYNRESVVLLPPVDDHFFTQEIVPIKKEYYLAIARLVPYKRIDLLIAAANERKFTLKIAGTGQDLERLRQLAGPTVEFLGFVPDADLPALYAHAKAYLMPQFEDAGVTPLEAQASGTPVIAFKKGGALDTVKEDRTGIFFEEQTVPSLLHAIDTFESMEFNYTAIREHVRQFSDTEFQKKFKILVDEAIRTYGPKKA